MASRQEPTPNTPERQVLLRALIWAIVGVITAPLFVALYELFRLAGFGVWSFIPAAAIAGGAGSIFYGAREVAIASSLIGVTVGSLQLLIPGAATAIWQPALGGLCAGIVGGYVVRFPAGCTSHAVGKAVAGAFSGALCGVFLVLAELFVPLMRTQPVAVAFLVSVTGVLYVSTVRLWVAALAGVDVRTGRSKQAVLIGVVAMLTSASVWIVANSIGGQVDSAIALSLIGMLENLPAAVIAGLVAGGITGALLEVFRFRWVFDL